MYPVCVIAGVLAWMLVTAWIWHRGGGDPIGAMWVCVFAAPPALLCARLFSSFTDGLQGVASPPLDFSQGGLGIYGAIAGGVAAIVIQLRARNWPVGTFLDCAVPGLALGQAIGRYGNWWNQELFGAPTNLPWGLYVDPAYRPAAYQAYDRFHPLFLYESMYDLLVCLVLLGMFDAIRHRFLPGAVAAVYLGLYGIGRFFLEFLRIDRAPMIGPLRFNALLSLFVVATALLLLVVLDRKRVVR
jgi:prolipoprotein diacylglyceryl transferase